MNKRTEEKGDLISRKDLLSRVDMERKYLLSRGQTGAEHILVHNFRDLIDNAPTADKGYQEGHIDGVLQAEKLYTRPIIDTLPGGQP